MIRILTLLAACIALLTASREARAADCWAAWTTGPVVDPKAGITLEAIDSKLECSGPRRGWTCRLREIYVVRGGASAGTPAALFFDARLQPAVRIDGVPPISAEVPTFGGEVGQRLVQILEGNYEQIGFVIPTSPGATRRIVIEMRIRHEPRCDAPVVIERRHPLVSRGLETGILLNTHGGLGMEPSGDFWSKHRVVLPQHWHLDGRGALRRDRDAGRGHWISPPDSSYRVDRRPPLAWGGPFAAVGVARRSREAELKLRAGWEFAIGRRFVFDVAAESDARRHVEIVPSAQLTMRRRMPRHSWYVPLPSVGIGAPVQLVPDRRGGIRGGIGFHWPYVGLVGFVDGYPPIGSRRRIVTGGAMLQLGI